MGIDNITSIEVYQTIKPTSRKGQQNDTRKKPATQADKRNKNHKKNSQFHRCIQDLSNL